MDSDFNKEAQVTSLSVASKLGLRKQVSFCLAVVVVLAVTAIGVKCVVESEGENEDVAANALLNEDEKLQDPIHEGECALTASGEMQQWDEVGSFSEGLVVVRKGDKWGYVNQAGEVVIELQWDYAVSFSEGMAVVKKDDKWGYISQDGEIVIDLQWNIAWSFNEGLAWVRKRFKWGCINQAGEVVIEPQWKFAGHFSEGMARVRKGGKDGYINQAGEVVIGLQWDDASWYFNEGLAVVKKDGRYGSIDTTGEVVSWRDDRPDSW